MDTGMVPPRTSRAGYVIGVVLILIGSIGSMALMFHSVMQYGDSVQRFEFPGTHEFSIEKPGSYELNYEFQSVIGSRTFNTGKDCPSLDCSVTSVDTGEAVPLQTSSVTSTYTTGSYSGTRLFKFDVDSPGRYRLSASYVSEGNPQAIVLSVSPGMLSSFFKLFMTPCLMTLLVPAGVLCVVVVFVKRRSQARTCNGLA